MADQTAQVFRAIVEPSALALPRASGMAAEQVVTWTVNQNDRFITVGPLDMEKFQDGDEVKVIVQRIGKRRVEEEQS